MAQRPDARRAAGLVVLALAAFSGCGSSQGSSSSPAETSSETSAPTQMPPQIASILAARCGPCHGSPPTNDAPMPLTSLEDVRAMLGGKPVYVHMQRVLMQGQMPPPPASLSDDERAALLDWLGPSAPTL